MAKRKNRLHPDDLMEAEHFLRRLLLQNGQQVAGVHRWMSEHERWTELVFALLAAVSKLPEQRVRAAVEELDALELLSPSELARIKTDGPHSRNRAKNILDVLRDSGMPSSEA